MEQTKLKPRILGASLGDPYSAGTYSGVPYHLYGQLEKRGELVGRLDSNMRRPQDVLAGLIDWKESIKSKRPRPSKYWRFFPDNIERLSRRFRKAQQSISEHNAVLQIGVGPTPAPNKVFMAHAEISVQAAATLPQYAETYGFESGKDRYLERAMEGEKQFLETCDVVWTNSSWTAKTFAWAGIPEGKFWVQPPPCNCDDPGPIEREWAAPRILFIGKDWERKGGPLLVEAFKELRKEFSGARLIVIGCDPDVRDEGVEVLGYLDKSNEKDRLLIEQSLREATLFCMPSHWESTGIVYMEAALNGLPVVMLSGQDREGLFPHEMAIHLSSDNVEELAEVMVSLSKDPDRMKQIGDFGAEFVRDNYTLDVLAERISARIAHELAGSAKCV